MFLRSALAIFVTTMLAWNTSGAYTIIDGEPDSLNIRYHYQPFPFGTNPDTCTLDTSLYLIQLYDPLQQSTLFYAGNGMIGGWNRALGQYSILDPYIEVGPGSRNPYLLTSLNLPIYRLKTPLTRASYSMGSGSEQLFNITHAQNLGMIDAGITYRIISTPGNYVNQRSQHDKWGAYISTSPNLRRLNATLSFTNNKITHGENGGLADLSSFEDTLISNRKLLDVNTVSAYSEVRRNELSVNASYLLIGMPDSIGKKKSKLWLKMDITRSRFARAYKDPSPDTSYYSSVFLNPSGTNDSLGIIDTRYTAGARYRWQGAFLVDLSGGFEALNLWGDITDEHWNNWGAGFGATASVSRRSHQFHLVYHTLSQGDRQHTASDFQAQYRFVPDSGAHLVFSYRNLYKPIPLYAQYWSGNHTRFELPGDRHGRTSTQMSLGVEWKGIRIEPSLELLMPFYFDSVGHPEVLLKTARVYQGRLIYKLEREGVGMYNQVLFQHNSAETILGLPSLAGFHAFWFRFPMFRRALIARAGFDIRYHGEYHALTYRPDIGSFTASDTHLIPAYIYLDPWVGAKIRNVRIFLKLSHANAGLLGMPYYASPGRPARDRQFIFGLDWIFYN